jgi:cytochrome c
MGSLLKHPTALIAGAILLAAAGGASAGGNAGQGRAVFNAQCSACHSLKPNQTILGPSLFGVVGRPAGTLKGFAYSAAMKGARWTWTADKLSAYLPDPGKMVPRTTMTYPGLKAPAQVNDLIAFLETQK